MLDPATTAVARGELAALLAELRPLAVDPKTADADLLEAFALAAGLSVTFAEDAPAAAALPLLRDALDALDRCPTSPLRAWIDYLRVCRLCAAGDLAAAAGAARTALEAPPNPPYDLHTGNLLASMLRALGRWEEAVAVLDDVEARLHRARDEARVEEIELDRVESVMLATRGEVEVDFGSPERAIELIARAEELARRTGNADAIAQAMLRRADLGLLTDRFAAVETTMDGALAGDEAGFTATQRAQFRLYRGAARANLWDARASRAQGAEDDLRAAIDDPALPEKDRRTAEAYLIELYLHRGNVDRARAVASSLRRRLGQDAPDARVAAQIGRVALALGLDRDALAEELLRLEAAYRGFLAAVARVRPRPGGVGFLYVSQNRQVVSTLIELALRVEGEARGAERALSLLLEAQATGTLARKLDAGVPTLGDIRSHFLGERHGVLIYLPARYVTHVFAVDGEAVVHARIPLGKNQLWGALGPLHTALLRRPDRGTVPRDRARAAADVLLPAAVRDRLARWRAVSVVGSEMMLGVPFDCLVLDDGEMLGVRCAVDALPSLPWGVAAARRAVPLVPRDTTVRLFATLAPAAAPPDAAPAAFGESDAWRLLAPFERDRVRLVLGSAFTRSALLDADLRSVAVLHVVAHGDYDHARERGAQLRVAAGGGAGDAVLRCEDIDRLRFRGLAVLCSCETARGPVRFGDDSPAHLGGSFLWAGARAVVLSRTAVHYETSMLLMEAFYSRLAAGHSPAEALRGAREELKGEGDPVALFHRSPLQVIGLGHLPLAGR